MFGDLQRTILQRVLGISNGGNDRLITLKRPRFMIENQRIAINTEPCQRHGRMRGNLGINILEIVAEFIREKSGYEEAFTDALFNLGKKPRYIFKPVDRNDFCRMEEEETEFIPAVEPRGLEQNEILLILNESVVC